MSSSACGSARRRRAASWPSSRCFTTRRPSSSGCSTRSSATCPAPQLVVVDSGSSDDGAELASAWRGGRAELVVLGENVGFGRGVNAGLPFVGRPVTALVNPDVELLDASLAALAREALTGPERLLVPARPAPRRRARGQRAARARQAAAARARAGARQRSCRRGSPRRSSPWRAARAAPSRLAGRVLPRGPDRDAAAARALRRARLPVRGGPRPRPARRRRGHRDLVLARRARAAHRGPREPIGLRRRAPRPARAPAPRGVRERRGAARARRDDLLQLLTFADRLVLKRLSGRDAAPRAPPARRPAARAPRRSADERTGRDRRAGRRSGARSAASSASRARWRGACRRCGRTATGLLAPRPRLAHRAGHLWEQVVLPLAARRAELIYCPANLAPLASRRNVVVIHDVAALAHPEWYGRAYAAYQRADAARARAPRAARDHGVRVLARRDRGAARRRAERIAVVPNGVAERFSPDADPAPAARARSASSARTCWPSARASRARTSGARPPRPPRSRSAASSWSRPARAAATCAPGEAPPCARSATSRSALLPGLYAGAARAGACRRSTRASACRCSRRWRAGPRSWPRTGPRCPEVCGDAALLVDPDDADALADALLRATGPRARAPRRRGTRARPRFTWERSAELDAIDG